MTASRAGTRGPPAAIAVAVDGTPADRAVLCWAAEEAEHDRRPVLVAHAVGHLPPELTYGERRVAREQVIARGAVLAERAARFVHRHAPSVTVSTVVRLLDPDALLPAIAGEASAVIRVAPAWHGSDVRPPELVVAAIGDAMTDAHVVWFASDFAARRGAELHVLQHEGRDVAPSVCGQLDETSLLVLPCPRGTPAEGYSWAVAVDMVRRSSAPVVLVSPEHGAAARGG